MRTVTKKRSHRVRIALYLYILFIFLILLTAATYTWFSLSKTPNVSDLAMYINAPHGLELSESYTGRDWVKQLSFSDLVSEETPLKPVTYSHANNQFMAAVYGFDGRMTGGYIPLTDESNANRADFGGYYTKATFYARCGESAAVRLSPAVEIEEGIMGSGTYLISTPVWNAETVLHESGGNGAQYAVRIGLRITKTDRAGIPLRGEPSTFYIYEPNCDKHIDDSVGYVKTPSIDGTDTLVPEENLILQTETSWTEAYPVQREVVVRDMGAFQGDTTLFSLDTTQLARIDLYIWLEGQDVDCTNRIGSEAKILASIQFDSDLNTGSGLETID